MVGAKAVAKDTISPEICFIAFPSWLRKRKKQVSLLPFWFMEFPLSWPAPGAIAAHAMPKYDHSHEYAAMILRHHFM